MSCWTHECNEVQKLTKSYDHHTGNTAHLVKLPHLLIWSCAAESASSTAIRRSRSSSSCSSKYLRSCFVLLCKFSVSDNLSENNQAHVKKWSNSQTILFLFNNAECEQIPTPFHLHRRWVFFMNIFKLFGNKEWECKSLKDSVSHLEGASWLCHPWPHLLLAVLKGHNESCAKFQLQTY